MTLRLVQLTGPAKQRRVAVVEDGKLRLLNDTASVYQLALDAIEAGKKIEKLIRSRSSEEMLDYDPIYRSERGGESGSESEWSLLPPFDHPTEPARCFVTGTGLTHKASAENRQSMHVAQSPTPEGNAAPPPAITDSMKMYQIGTEGGRPKSGRIGSAPEWFYKGTGSILRAHNQSLDVPNHADDGGDEAEIAGCYVIASDGTPHRVGFVQGNEFSDHILETKNYLYLAQSKLRHCSIGPEIVIGSDLSEEIRGHATVERNGKTIWAGPQSSGEPWMCHSLTNLEHHHFKHDEHRRAGDAHLHFFGADLFSFKDRLVLEEGDTMVVAFIGFGRPLRNPIHIDRSEQHAVKVKLL